ncbi:Putative uncharacterized protein [Halomonas sp. R57-5]|nr:Putative uncharacterized protein [Halomonas sp. R57-5]
MSVSTAPLRTASRVRSAYHALRKAQNQVLAHTVARGNESARDEQRGTRGWRRNDAQWHKTNPSTAPRCIAGALSLTTRYENHKPSACTYRSAW